MLPQTSHQYSLPPITSQVYGHNSRSQYEYAPPPMHPTRSPLPHLSNLAFRPEDEQTYRDQQRSQRSTYPSAPYVYPQGAYNSQHVNQAHSYHPMSPKNHHSNDYPPGAAGGAGSYQGMQTKGYDKGYSDATHKNHGEDHGNSYNNRWRAETEHEPVYRNGYKPAYPDVYGDEDNDWAEGDSMENGRDRRKREYTDRVVNINSDFMDNYEAIYQEKLNALQEDLLAIQQESHPSLRECIADLEKVRQQVIHQARLIMEYHITCTDEQFQTEISSLEDDYTAEKQGMRDMMLNALEEKRKKLRDEKDNENDIANDIFFSTHQTRNRKRIMRKRGGILDAESLAHYRSPNSVVNAVAKRRHATDHILLYPLYEIGFYASTLSPT
ncbi:Sds3-like-domain-containing protein [Umbelopsis sp. PMI_123]|nr:Sds3-like-domain-containing protein [Umbelopsis sp. PMI_123]